MSPRTNGIIEAHPAVKKVADAVVNLMQILKDTRLEIRSSDCFKIICDTMRRAIGIADTSIEPDTNQVATLTQSMSQEEYHGSQWSESLNALLKAAEERELLENRLEFPSFSLGTGFTQDVYARADIVHQNGGFEPENEVLIHKKQTDNDVLMGTTGGGSDGDIEEHHLLVASLSEYESDVVEPDMIVGNNGAKLSITVGPGRPPCKLAGGMHNIPKGNENVNISLDDSLCRDAGINAETANAIKMTNSIVDDIIARENEQDHADSIICSAMEVILHEGVDAFFATTNEHQQALGVEKTHGTTLEVSETQDRHPTTDKTEMEAPPKCEKPVQRVRTRAMKRMGPALCSPYNERAVPVTIKLSSEEKDMYYWVVWTQGDNE
ncbi:hypothetical protein AAHA92_31281 [Salvia divinorum]|uniref:Uncharacterized protein n=1 Tax=Salvia divinorum TaxID=28513 RepID=A0ABD1FTN1_SALDI